MTDLTSRREFLAATGVVTAGWLGTDPGALLRAMAAAGAAARGEIVQYDVLTADQAADLDAIAAQIIPSDRDLPGAREARVVVFIDRALGSFQADQKEAMLTGLDDLNRQASQRWPGAGRFATLTDERQRELLRAVEDGPFFKQVRAAVITGMFAHPQWGGNYGGAGYKVLDFEPRFIWQPPFGEYDAEAGQ